MLLHPQLVFIVDLFFPGQSLLTQHTLGTMPARLEFHEGEVAMRRDLKVPSSSNPTFLGLAVPYARRVAISPIVALGTLDDRGRPWTTVWGGERGFAQPVAADVLGFSGAVDRRYDPVVEAFWKGAGGDGEVVQHGGEDGGQPGKIMSALAIDLETRDRVKLAGLMIAGAEVPGGGVQIAMHVKESMGNCPKYINKKDIVPHQPRPELVSDGLVLPPEAVELIGKADMFFLSSTSGETMDTNHRGGPSGFMRVAKNGEDGVELVYPEYSGNRLYQTLGNLRVNPLVGIVIPDYETSDALYLTGSASILMGQEASSLLPRSNLAVKITVTSSRFVKSSLPFRGAPQEYSPYNPPVRHLLSERDPHIAGDGVGVGAAPEVTATLVRRDAITPTINVFTFKLEAGRGGEVPRWLAGQHVTLNFELELSTGYSHMRDDDPQSLNDDFVRTFTVSSLPPVEDDGNGSNSRELQITARLHGPATGLLWKHNLRVPLELGVMGFGGQSSFHLPTTTTGSSLPPKPVFIAGGVGITPILAQAQGVLDGGVPLQLLWTLRSEDLALAIHVFDKVPKLAAVTTLFVTTGGSSGKQQQQQQQTQLLEATKGRGAKVEERRLGVQDLESLKGEGKDGGLRRFYLCTGPGLLKMLTGWLEGEDVVWEDFGY